MFIGFRTIQSFNVLTVYSIAVLLLPYCNNSSEHISNFVKTGSLYYLRLVCARVYEERYKKFCCTLRITENLGINEICSERYWWIKIQFGTIKFWKQSIPVWNISKFQDDICQSSQLCFELGHVMVLYGVIIIFWCVWAILWRITVRSF